MKLSILSIVSALAVPSLARYVLYLDQYHLTTLPNKTTTAGIDTVIMAFANSTLFTTNPAGNYTPFQTVASVRELFDDGAQVMIAIGGWSDNSGFDMGATNETTRALFASNVAQMLDDVGADGVDIDWEYPAGNGADYKIVPNSAKVSEIETYPLFLSAIKSAIGNKTLSVAVPGLERDMIAFTEEQAPKIWESVDMVNVMTYDLMNRRDNITGHHTSINGSLDAVDKYMSLNLTADKINLGFAFYAKYFLTNDTSCATEPLGCATALLEDPTDGSDTGNSGAMTFEIANYQTAPTNLTASTDGSCGASVFAYCDGTASGGSCCSQYGYCGDTNAHCGLTCQPDYGNCTGATAGASWVRALNSSVTDEELGGQYYWDSDASIFWTMDTPALITKKFTDIVKAKGLGGVMAWSAGEDSYDWSHLLALQAGVAELGL